MGRPRYLQDKPCKACGKVFRPDLSTRKFCSYPCALKSKPKRGVTAKCEACSKEFYVRPGSIGRIKYCSMKCSGQGKIKEKSKRVCGFCQKGFEVRKSQEYWRGKAKFCSVDCRGKGKKPTIGALDTLWSKLVKLKAGNKCEYCGKTEGLNSHHIFSRSNRTTRWDDENGVSLCVAHHVFGTFSAHKAPLEFAEWLKETRGEEWYKKIRFRAQLVEKPNLDSFKKMLTSKIEALESSI